MRTALKQIMIALAGKERQLTFQVAAFVDRYLEERRLCYDTDDEPKEYIVCMSIPQSSVLIPLLWNFFSKPHNCKALPE